MRKLRIFSRAVDCERKEEALGMLMNQVVLTRFFLPLLCHQEYLQLIYGLDTKERVRALAKGRWFPKKMSGIDGKGSGSDQILPEEQDQEGQKEGELFMGEDLSELQQLGREKMLERLDKLTRRID